ncbi:MAG: hypothetical protein LUI39_13660 [Lachnospiraceae bacterium]|nr:hypothetical protein [Lachnospiraceae bacterium]
MDIKKVSSYSGYTEARKAANAKYEAETVERISLVLPKGQKKGIRLHAEQIGESVNNFIVRAINDRIRRKGELTDYFTDQWGNDDSQQIALAESYSEKLIVNQIDKLEENTDNVSKDFINALYYVNQNFIVQLLTSNLLQRERLWGDIEGEYDNCIDDLHNFFDPYVEDYDNSIAEMKDEFIFGNVKQAME